LRGFRLGFAARGQGSAADAVAARVHVVFERIALLTVYRLSFDGSWSSPSAECGATVY